jgi:hypothetical protein
LFCDRQFALIHLEQILGRKSFHRRRPSAS